MSYLDIKKYIEIIIETCDKYNITAYEIGNATGLNVSGVQRILNNEVEKPRQSTVKKILKYLEDKTVGSKLEHSENPQIFNEPSSSYIPIITNDRVVPYYNIEINSGEIHSWDEAQKFIEFYIDYKPLNDCTAYLPYYGKSMYPLFKPGDTIAIKQIYNFDVILYGNPYFIVTDSETNNYKTVRCLYQHPDEDKLILRAKNPEYAGDIVISKKNIVALFIVRGKIELNE